MKTSLIKKHNPRVLIFRNGKIGNTIIAVPFIEKIKEIYPDATVYLVVDNLGFNLLKSNPCIDGFFIFDRNKDSLSKQYRLIKNIKLHNFDISIHLRTGIRNELIAFLSKIPIRIGFKLKGSLQFLTHITPRRKGIHVHTELSELLAYISRQNVNLCLPRLYCDHSEELNVSTYLKSNNIINRQYIVLHPGGETVNGLQWSLNYYKEIINIIHSNIKINIIIIGGRSEEERVRKKIATGRFVHFIFHKPIQFVSELIHQSSFFIGNDSGPAHIAQAWQIPSVIFYKNNMENFTRWKPLNPSLAMAIFKNDFEYNKPYYLKKIIDYLGHAYV